MVVLGDFIAVPERPAWLDDDLDTGLRGGLCDGLVAGAGVCVRVLFEDEMRGLPGFEEFGEQSLRTFSQDEQFGLFVELCDGF